MLVADEIFITRDRVLVARGNVEAFQGNTRLEASEIRYDRASGQLLIEGPIRIDEGDGIIILADQANLSEDLQNGLLSGARLVLNEQLQLAAVELSRVEGRYTQLYKTAVTSCAVCEGDPRPPLWQIRARRVVHDTEERQLYFDQATLRFRNIPVLYLPRLRLPDPTLDRATGFLIPQIRSTSQLGIGIKAPYFIKLGDHRDLTLTPYLSPNTRTLEFRYRQAFVRGRVEFNGALTRDDLLPDTTRSYLFGQGRFDLKRGYVLSFDLKSTSDIAYLKDYDYSDADRLKSEIRLRKVERDAYTSYALINFRTLREGEDNTTLPSNILQAAWERRYHPARIGGEFRLAIAAQSHIRTSSLASDSDDPDDVVDGRDVLRLNVDADWRRTWLLGGLEAQGRVGFYADTFRITQDVTFDEEDSRFSPTAALTLRYPLVRRAPRATQVLEPVAQLSWSNDRGLDVPNEESTRVEFDEANLLSLSRFPAPDRRETGLRAALGVNWARYGDKGNLARLTFGQVFRQDVDDAFTKTAGLGGRSSDFLMAGQLKWQNGLSMSMRGLFDSDLAFSRAEIRGDWVHDRVSLSSSVIYLGTDVEEDRFEPISEFNFDGSVRLSDDWTASARWRYDIEDGRAATSGLGLTYENECLRVAFSVDQRFTSSTSVEPQTSLGLTVSLQGFSTGAGPEKYARACGKNAS